ncbi:hypothetical protein TWF694_001410 [Orbilia ellipsospora]|uniref:Uncharacterized protein n=1 Tax=Orbilia ellipsospora TaxID=2528407 RepID=A0AAV9XU27_9PEZI
MNIAELLASDVASAGATGALVGVAAPTNADFTIRAAAALEEIVVVLNGNGPRGGHDNGGEEEEENGVIN